MLQSFSFQVGRLTGRKHKFGSAVGKTVSLITVTIPNDSASSTAEVGEFLAQLLRRNELLFQTGTYSWLLLAPLSELELREMLERLQCSFRDANHNRPYGTLLEVVFERIGSWSGSDEREQIIQRFLTQFESSKECVAFV